MRHNTSRRYSNIRVVASVTTPNDHFTAGPDCCVIDRAEGALVVLVAVQLSVLGSYLPPVFKVAIAISTPDDHFTAGPDCRVIRSRAVGALVVLVAVQLSVLGLYLPPVFKAQLANLHPRRSFHCRSRLPCDYFEPRARWWCWWLSNYPCWDCISRRCSNDCCR